MKYKHLAIPIGAILICSIILLSCRKINEATTLGDDLIPPVDNITTFDTTLDVEVFNDTFSVTTDSTRYTKDYTHYLGYISNDPFFGITDARIYMQLKPPAYKYTFLNKPDSLHIDSVVLILDYVETYGDTTADQTVNVYEISQTSDFHIDTIGVYGGYRIRSNNFALAGQLGSRTFKPMILNDSVKAYQDTTVNQLRIRLDDSFGQRLLNYDSASGVLGAYASDSAFDSKFRGFALESVSGNALMGFNLAGANTKLAIYYKDDNNDAPVNKWDTAVAYFQFNTNARSASAQLVKRGYNGTPVAAAAGLTAPADLVYIQATPGSFARIKIPGLSGLNNRVVHRAELIMEENYHLSDSMFPAPTALFLDAWDATATKYRTVPYDFAVNLAGTSNLGAFGSYPYITKDPSGNTIRVWRFNLSRYVQHLVNGTEPVYDFRLTAPLYLTDRYSGSGSATGTTDLTIGVNPVAARGRVRLFGGGDGSQPGANPQRMRLRIVYSKI